MASIKEQAGTRFRSWVQILKTSIKVMRRIQFNKRSAGFSQTSEAKHGIVADLRVTVSDCSHQHREQTTGEAACDLPAPRRSHQGLQQFADCTDWEGPFCHCARGFLLRETKTVTIQYKKKPDNNASSLTKWFSIPSQKDMHTTAPITRLGFLSQVCPKCFLLKIFQNP